VFFFFFPFESLRSFIKFNPYACERKTCQERDDVRLQILLTVQSKMFADVAVIVGRTGHGGIKQRGTSEEPMLQVPGV